MEPFLTALEASSADVRVEFGMVRAEFAAQSATRAFAEQLAAIHATLAEARAFPEVFLGPAFTAPSGGASPASRDAVEFAERAAVADLAVRLCVSEQTVRAQAHQAELLLHRAPRVWAKFREGIVSTANAREIADVVATLPNESWVPFEDAVLIPATVLAPARFKVAARAVRARVNLEDAALVHRRRADERRVWIEPDTDGMAWLTAYLPATLAHRALHHLDHMAESLAGHPDETRTLAQIRADVAGDLLAGVLGSAAPAVGVRVAVTVPVMTLLGRGDEPGILEGYGPIDADTARRLAGHAPSFTRILTHPVTGTVLDVDRTTYRVPADLKRWLEIRDGGCVFPGCGRRARDCDLDHTTAWADGGVTSADNLAHLCRHHHRLKHKTGWSVERDPANELVFTSPTGATRGLDPPPF